MMIADAKQSNREYPVRRQYSVIVLQNRIHETNGSMINQTAERTEQI